MARKAVWCIGVTAIGAALVAWWRTRVGGARDVDATTIDHGAGPVDASPSLVVVPDHRSGPAARATEPEPGPGARVRPAPPAVTAELVVAPADAGARWVEPVDGACPDGYPIKVNARSGIYHVPGGLSYERTVPTRCYAAEADAEADGFRRAKR